LYMKLNITSLLLGNLPHIKAMLLSVVLSLSSIAFAQLVNTQPTNTQAANTQPLCCDKTANGVCVQPMPARPSPSRANVAGRYGDLYKRMDKLDIGNCAHAYYLHKTQAWVNLSRDLYHEGDGTAAVNAAYDEAEKLIKALEDGKTPSLETILIQDAAKLRPDLWQIAANRKSTPALLSSAAREVAYCEVYLVRAGHAQTNLGTKARVEPLIGMAQDICHAAKDKPPCPIVVLPVPPIIAPVPVVPPPSVVAPKAVPVVSSFTLGADALFDVNKAALKPAGKVKIEAMLTSLQSVAYTKIIVTGHTDSDASEAYNQALSFRRAIAVKAYLVSKGVDTKAVEVSGMGAKQPVAENTTIQGKAQNRRVVIQVLGATR
jgi:outer membrane protein OmpA-like peptidoglycan-associated protein